MAFAVTLGARATAYRAKGHDYVTLVADEAERKVIYVAEGNEAATVEAFAANLRAHHGKPTQIESVSIDMWPAFIRGVTDHFPNAQITFDKFHVISHASTAIDEMRRREQKLDPSLKGLRWTLLKDRSKLTVAQRTELDALLSHLTTTRTARAWQYREQLREVEPIKEVAQMIRSHFEGILAWVTSRQTNGFLEAINGLFQAAKRKARGYGGFRTIRTVIFLIAGKLDLSRLNSYVALPT